MLLPVGDYCDIIDISDRERSLYIAGEATTRREAELIKKELPDGRCEVYVEVGQELYRVVCEKRRMTSTPTKITEN